MPVRNSPGRLRPSPGFRLRQKRRDQGITQAALAARAGISASYLNLIEHGKREVAGALLRRLADCLGLELASLTGQEDARLVQDLTDIATDPALRDLSVDGVGAQEIVGGRPEWGRAVVRLHRRYQQASVLVETLSHRLAHDATLVEASHELLTRMTSVRSFSEILAEHGDITPDQRIRFTGLIADESARLGDIARAVFDRLSDFDASVRATTPAEEVDDFIVDNDNYFSELEARAEVVAAELRESGDSVEAALVTRLRKRHGVRVDVALPDLAGPITRNGRFDVADREFQYPAAIPPATLRFQLARLVFSLEEADAVTALVDDRRLTSEDARRRAAHALDGYGAGAVLFPYEAFRQAAGELRHDLDRLSALFGGSMEQICHRLITLRRPEAAGVPFGFLRVDPAGNISKRFGLPSLRLPRFGGVCPLWTVYTAMRTMGSLMPQRVRLPDGREFLFVARAFSKPAPAYGLPAKTFSVMIACDAVYAREVVYGDGLMGDAASILDSGINCHLCPREACPQRAYPQLAGAQ